MTFDTLQYTDAGGMTQEIALRLANLCPRSGAVQLTFDPRSHAPSEFHISWPAPPETGIAIPFKSRCIVYASRESAAGAPNSFSNGTILFQGRRTDNSGSAGVGQVVTSITLSDLFWDLSKITYAIPWRYISGGTTASPVYSTIPYQDIVMFQAMPGTTYTPPAINGTITTFQQIKAIIDYAASYATGAEAVQVQIGSTPEFQPAYVNWYPIRSAKCLESILVCLRPHPSVYTEVDYTTTPPTIHFRGRANLTAVTLPYKTTDANGIVHLATSIQALPELVPDAVRLWYRINATFNGQPIVNFTSDIYPPGAGNSLLCLDYSIDITGATTAETIYNFTSYAFDPTSLALWRKKVNSLKQISEGGQIPNDGSAGALALLDATINGGTTLHPDGIQVVDESGAALNLGTYRYYTDQSIYAWMKVSGAPVGIAAANIVGVFAYTKNTGGALNLTPKIGKHSHSMRLKLTNAPSGTYVLEQTLNAGESIPPNLAQYIYNELAELQWKLSHEIIQIAADTTSVPTLIKPGKHKINLAGGDAAWTTMNAVPESVRIEFHRTAAGRLVARHQISCGPVNHLEPGYLVQLSNLFCNRSRSGIDPTQRLSGSGSSSQVNLSAETARENSVPATPDHQVQILFAPDAADNTRTIVMQHDAPTGQIQVVQKKSADGTNYTSGVIAPQYTGSGAPSATTLATNAYYRVLDRYFDGTSRAEYICTSAGDKTAATWAQLGGTTAGTGFNWRGLWTASPASSYMTNDAVLLGSGTAAGIYLSLLDNNSSAPDSGYGWTQISSYCTWL